VPEYHERILQVGGGGGVEHIAQYEDLTKESLRGRAGGAVTLAVGMAHIFDGAAQRFWSGGGEATLATMWKYWYHFAIMFEALFILTTIDAGTRIGRFLLQEVAGKVIHPRLGDTSWWPGALVSTLLVVVGWAWFMNSDSFRTIWTVFGIANQLLAVIALAVVSAWLVNEGRARYLWVTLIPMAVVITTTGSAAVLMLKGLFNGIRTQLDLAPDARNWTTLTNSSIQAALLLAMLVCGIAVVLGSLKRILYGTPPGEGRRREPAGLPGFPVEPVA
jgi:carbon starvation protein